MKNDLFIFIGDSLTFGYGVSKNETWVYKLQKSLNCNLINRGINGNTTAWSVLRILDTYNLRFPLNFLGLLLCLIIVKILLFGSINLNLTH